jgi:hypothetical protein
MRVSTSDPLRVVLLQAPSLGVPRSASPPVTSPFAMSVCQSGSRSLAMESTLSRAVSSRVG